MPFFNQVTLMGNLVRDAEIKELSNGNSVCEFTLAVNSRWTDRQSGEKKEKAMFIDCSLFGPRGDALVEYTSQGDSIHIVGKLDYNRWEKDGLPQSKHSVSVNSFEFVRTANKNQEGDDSNNENNQESKEGAVPF